jgi:N-acyl-D-amino-acid deacylase
MFDLLIKNGRVVDGSGNPWVAADVAVKAGRIAAVGRLGDVAAATVVEALGRIVCPGFIDGHSHSDLYVLAAPESRQKIMQGFTTEVIGLDGMSVAPVSDARKPGWQKHLSGLAGNPSIPWNWNSLGDYLDVVDANQASVNICSYAGLGTIRLNVIGMDDRAPTASEMEQMRRLTAEAMEQGARGLSAGLIYPPSQYQSLEEMVELCRVAARYDGIFDVHMRNESDRIAESIEEVLEIGRRAGIPVLITHFKVRGRKNWGCSERLLERLEKARAEGIDVTTSQYPYTAGSTFLHAAIPPWYHRQGAEALLEALKSRRAEIKRDIAQRMDWENFSGILGWENIYVSSVASEANRNCEGKRLSQIAAERGVEPADAACDLLVEEELAVGMIAFGLDEADIGTILRHALTSVITDGLLSGSKPHPRAYATSARILGRYVREQGVISLEDAVRKLTSLPAAKVRLRRKGLLAAGFDADIVVFDPATVIDTNSYEDPMRHPAGIEHVVVGGQLVVKNGVHTGAKPGRTIRDRQ